MKYYIYKVSKQLEWLCTIEGADQDEWVSATIVRIIKGGIDAYQQGSYFNDLLSNFTPTEDPDSIMKSIL